MTQQRTAIARADLIAAGRTGKPWAFLPTAIAAIASVPDDQGIRFLLASNFAQLGLRTPALEHLDQLGPEAAANPDVVALRDAIEALPDDRISPARAHDTLMRNIRALRATRPHLSDTIAKALPDWSRRHRESRVERLRTVDGNVLERHDGRWRSVADIVSIARQIVTTRLIGSPGMTKPVVIEGARPPWLLQQAMAATPPVQIGYQPRIILVQADPVELFDGLAMADLTSELTESRLHVEIGPDAAERLGVWMDARRDTQLAGLVAVTPGTTTAEHPSLAEAITRVVRAQESEHLQLQARVHDSYATRDSAYWGQRFEMARQGGEPLRAIIPTSINSTFVQHAARDLANALEAHGCETRVIIERSHHELLASTAFLRALDEHRPDFVLMINHTRRVPLGDLLPANLPVVTWVQDSMPDLFTPASARADGPLDFVVGHLLDRVVAELGVDRARTLAMPVAVDPVKFHPEPLSDAVSREHACDVSIATHQSETPDELLSRWMDQQTEARVRRIGEGVARSLLEVIESGDGRVGAYAKRFVQLAVQEAHGKLEPTIVDSLRYGLAMPLADRALRHRAIAWCADIARREGRTFSLWGNGWDRHAGLARFARGPAAHGEQLRAIYQASGIHLHVSAHTLVHQRVVECALSGGLAGCYLSDAALAPLRSRMQHELIGQAEPARTDEDGIAYYTADASPLAEQFTQLAEACNVPSGIYIGADLRERLVGAEPLPEHLDPAWLMGDLLSLGFRSRDQLAKLIARAADDPAWRAAQSEGIAERAHRRYTPGAMIQPMLRMMTDSLRARAPVCEAAA